MKNGCIIKVKEELLKPGMLSNDILYYGLYKAFSLISVPLKSYSVQKSKWIPADGLYLVVEDKTVVNIKNHIYFNAIKVLDPSIGQIVYVNKDHFCEIGDNNEL